jgi:hypothetical protein
MGIRSAIVQSFFGALLVCPTHVVAQSAGQCGDPPPVADEALKGELRGQAQFLTRFLGSAELGGQVEQKKTEIFSRYPDAERSRANAFLQWQMCILIMNSRELNTREKLQYVIDVHNFLFPPPPPNGRTREDDNRPLLRPLSLEAATIMVSDLMRLMLSTSSDPNVIAAKLNAPLCSEPIIWSKEEIRIRAEAGYFQTADFGRTLVTVNKAGVIGEINLNSAFTVFEYSLKITQTLRDCLVRKIISNTDYLITVRYASRDMQKAGTTTFIVDRQSGSVKGIF